jgi:hypothetical protein
MVKGYFPFLHLVGQLVGQARGQLRSEYHQLVHSERPQVRH